MRGESGSDNLIWICSETWGAPHYNGYMDHTLIKSKISQISTLNGTIMFQRETGKDEFFLTSRGTRCYFYYRGKEGEKTLLGLKKAASQNAEIFYRDISNWDEKINIFTFPYV